MIVLRNAHVVDVALGTTSAPIDILIEGQRIITIRDAIGNAIGDQDRDCSGKYLIPGLFDCHTHIAFLTTPEENNLATALREFVDRGVLYVRDVGGPIDVLNDMHRRISEKKLNGPRIFYTGPMLESSPLYWERFNEQLTDFTVAVDTEEDIRRLLPALAEHGACMVKTFNHIPLALYRRLLDVARQYSLRVVHDPGSPLFNWVPIDKAIELGVTSIEHAKAPWPFVLEDRLRKRHNAIIESDAGPEDRTKVMMDVANAGRDGISDERLETLAAMMRENEVFLCPTLNVFNEWKKSESKEEKSEPDPEEHVRKRMRAAMEDVSYYFIDTLSRHGVHMFLGTDGFSAKANSEEMSNMRRAGISTIEILRGATIYPAKWLGVDNQIGSIEPGKTADIVILDADPLHDIQNVEAVSAVIQGGRFVGDQNA